MAAASAWLVQTILSTLKIDKLDSWIRQVGLADDIQKLKSEIRRVERVVSDAKDKGGGNELLDEAFALLEERLYEADDLVDELDYYRLQQQVQGLPAPADPSEPLPLPLPGVTRGDQEDVFVAERVDEMLRGDAGTQQSNAGNLRSVVWDYFTVTETVAGKRSKAKCNYCRREFKCDTTTNGTSSMIKHLEKEHSVNCKKSPGAHPPDPSSSSTGEPTVIGSSSSRKGKRRRSKAWELFDVIEEENEQPMKARCKYCPAEIKCGPTSGTAGMLNHNKICKNKPGPNDQSPNPSSTSDAHADVTPILIGDSSTRKWRMDESVQITAANTVTPWDKTELSNRIQKIVSQLQYIGGEVGEILKLHGSNSTSSSHHHRSTTSDQPLRTSSLVPRNVYGRVKEKEYIMKLMMTEERSDNITVVPIVGIAGVGKTTLAQLVYNDPEVHRHFHHRIWVWVSCNFDEMRLTRDMLSFVSEGSHEGIDCFAKLQEILRSHVKSKRALLIFDDVWDDRKDGLWNQLLAPFKADSANGNVILVTTRKLSVAKMIGRTEPIKLGSLENDDFFLLFKSCAFDDGNHECLGYLSTIGRQIAEKLKGNPLAAVTTGALLRDQLTIDHWSNILKKENWKSLGLSGGIMPSLKLSYDELPYRLQQCFSYCSIFPDKHRFLGKDLVYIWISQGFVNCTGNIRLEETGWEYLNDLVNLGFFQQVDEQDDEDEEEEESSRGSQIRYSMCGLMHDFARMVSETECATIDGLQCNKMLPTIHHLSIITVSAYNKDQRGNIPRNEKFEENLRNTVTSVTKLRTIILLGHFDSFFIQLFQDIFRKAQNLRLLQASASTSGYNPFWCSLANPLHLRYLKLELYWVVPQDLSTFFHLQVFDVGYMNTYPHNGLHNLVSLRHLVAPKRVHSSIVSIGNLTSIQELHDFEVRISTGFEIKQLKSMNELVQLGVSQLGSVKTREEAYGAGLRNKKHLEELHLSWNGTFSNNVYASNTRSESSLNMAREVIEGLEPHMDLKHLHISGYIGNTSPTWLANNISVTSLQTLHLDYCGGWKILPSLESLPLLTKLKLRSMREVIEVLVPSLEELVLVRMPKLERCSCSSVGGMSSSLRELQIEDCKALKEFDLFENNNKFEIEWRSWLPSLRKLILCDCPQLEVLKPLPPSTICCELLINGVSMLPSMKGSSSEKLHIGYTDDYRDDDIDDYSDRLRILDASFLAFCNLRNLTSMEIYHQKKLRSFSFKDFSHLVSLKSLEIKECKELFSSDVTPEHNLEDVTAFPSLQSLTIEFCGTVGRLLSLMLQHAPNLEELNLQQLPMVMEEQEKSLSNISSEGEDSPSGNPDEAFNWLAQADEPLYIPLNLVSSIKKIIIHGCPFLTFHWSNEALSGFASLEKLTIRGSPVLLWSLVHKEGSDDGANGRWLLPTSLRELHINGYHRGTLQPCFPGDITSLKELFVDSSLGLEFLQLHSCVALEELTILDCESLTALEGLQFLGSLRRLYVSSRPDSMHKHGCDDQENGRWFLPKSLQVLNINYFYSQETLQPCFPSDITSLKTLTVSNIQGLQSLQLHSCTALEELEIRGCGSLTALESMQPLGSLGCLNATGCPRLSACLESFSRLCPRLERLVIDDPSVLTTSFCKHLNSLQVLQLGYFEKIKRLTDEQERALVLLKSLQELRFHSCKDLVDLPAGLHALSSLKILTIGWCRGISRLPETGLPLSLEELGINFCSKELAVRCGRLATTKLKVRIDYRYMNFSSF